MAEDECLNNHVEEMSIMDRKIMAGIVMGAGLVFTGCSMVIPSQIEYPDADAAKEALNHATTVTFLTEDLEDADAMGNILADEKIAGYMSQSGLVNIKWTVNVDDQDWFYLKMVTDEPINDVEGVKTGSTYGYYDMDDNCLGYGQERVITPEGGEEAWYIQFLDADGNPKEDYYATEDGTMLLDSEGNVIARVDGSIDMTGSGCTINFVMEDGVDQEVDIKDKIVMTMPKFDKLKRYYLDNYM